MAVSSQQTKRKLEELDETGESPCKKQHRDITQWNRQKAEFCLSCGAFPTATITSDLHTPFKFGDEIRLLRLYHSSDSSDDLVGSLVHVRIQDSPEYEAVSYTWADENGDASPSARLYIMSKASTFKITRNCEAALRKFRSQHATRVLWIDSICIDQRNSIERSEQVQMMTSIYKQAQRVLVFIGNPPESDLEAYRQLFDCMKTEKNLVAVVNGAGVSWVRKGSLYNLLRQNTHPKGLRDLRGTLIKFLEHSWFHRIWVIQEIVMARTATVYYGPFVLDWEDISLSHCISGPGRGSNMALIPVDSSVEIYIPPVLRLKRIIRTEGARLVDLLYATRICAATDSRDKIFALLGMAYAENGLELPRVDYTRSVEDVFADATTYCIRSTRGLEILSTCLSSAAGTASWSADFTRISNLSALPVEQGFTFQIDWFRSISIFIDDQNLEPGLLGAHGIRIDTIKYIQNDQHSIKSASLQQFPEEHLASASPVKQLFKTSPSFEVPSLLLHCPPQQRMPLPFCRPSPGVDPDDLLAIDLLAPYREYQENRDGKEKHSPYCTSTLQALYKSIQAYGQGRAVFCGAFTMGIAPANVQSGDVIWILSTAKHPFVLRPKGERYQIIGPCMIIGPNKRSGCKSHDHGKPRCNCKSCKSREMYQRRTKIEHITLV